jgi:signal transduction histidine kinase
MMDERFGPIANDRYRQYLKDIRSSGTHVISLINDLLDLSKIEAGKLDLSFVSVDLNETMRQCVAIMQPEANRERVIIRTALPKNVPPVVADARSVRQIALNLLSNSIKFSGAGGQVIVSTTVTDTNEVVLRVRDTGHGMSEKDLATALEPFRQIAISSRPDASGTGLGLPITKALAEANHAHFRITSRVEDGTLVEITFPATRVLMQ